MAQYNFKMALCDGRHEIKEAADGSIFKGEVDPLAVALVAVLNVCRQEGVDVTLWHFNRETGEYYPQEVR